MSTAEAAARLGVKPATLYAYVSRGLLGRERSAHGRTSTFDPDEVDRLARRPSAELVVPSALTAIDHGLPWYRGLAVPELARTRGFEEVAEWLWTGRFPDPAPTWQASQPALDAGRRAQAALPPAALPLERIRVIAAALPAGDELRLELHPAAVTAAGRSLIAGLVDCLPRLAPRSPGPGPRKGRRGRRASGPALDPIAVRFGVVESINTTIKGVLRRARGMRDEEMLLLKLKWATARPIRSARDLVRFLTAQPLYSNR